MINIGSVLWDWVDDRKVVRRIVLFATLWLTLHTGDQVAIYYYAHAPSVDMAAVIAAITAPVMALQGMVFKWYSDSRATGG